MANQTDRAAFYLCLARAFLPPQDELACDAIKSHLADDLAELAAALSYPAAPVLHELREAIAAVPDRLTLLQAYSRLFLAPWWANIRPSTPDRRQFFFMAAGLTDNGATGRHILPEGP
ncbi:MAG: hypothetical protein A3G24_24650 [Betaproteobacteria bacterium RIFCSPLOWO2_12_FULL_62_13]|nr:MAG: hypothetical protein A3G24_24650 [Betaproteobacteria bacterium RIFCSPLOWO2_12_FULL_62_13]